MDVRPVDAIPASRVKGIPSTPCDLPASRWHLNPLHGSPSPLGAEYSNALGAYNFAVYSSSAAAVTLVLFTTHDLSEGHVTHEVPLDPVANRTGSIWHIALPDLDQSILYGYKIRGQHQDADGPDAYGHRHNPYNVVLDPYAKAVVSRERWGELGRDLDYPHPDVHGLARTWPQAAGALPPRGGSGFDWQGDTPLNTPMSELIIYEAHVRGFTADSASGVQFPGTYQGMVDRLDYLVDLGVTAVELLPIFEFNELEYYSPIPGTDLYKFNFWGYSTASFFAPMPRYSSTLGQPAFAAVNELKLLVREAHKRGIEIILDVVFNHTAEGNEMGPSISFRGLDNRTYYMLAPEGQYYNYSGCGNTFNCNDPIGRQFILDCLRYWVQEYHVDGFRFDLASIMTRAPSAWHPSEWVLQDIIDIELDEKRKEMAAAREATRAAALAELEERLSAMASDTEGGSDMDTLQTGNGADGWSDSEISDISADDEILEPVSTAIHSSGAIRCPAGFMTDGAGLPTGTPLSDPPLIEMISEDPILRNTKMIAEAWDCDGLKQVGSFPHYGGRWSEWNGDFRDSVRAFIKGTEGNFIGAFASALMGSPDQYANTQAPDGDWWGNNGGAKWRGNRSPTHTINFVTAHDGFTIADLVSYNEKHNDQNGESGNDGENHNLSWNCGIEGLTDDPKVTRLRNRQLRNFCASLLTSQGIPMMLMGDEYGHSKGGNNNTYCHDSMLNYVNWKSAAEDTSGIRRFWKHMIQLRKSLPELGQTHYLNGSQVEWHGAAGAPDWDSGRFLGVTLKAGEGATDKIYLGFNTSHTPVMVNVPGVSEAPWKVLVDTSKAAPYDILVPDHRLSHDEVKTAQNTASLWLQENSYPMMPWSFILLESRR